MLKYFFDKMHGYGEPHKFPGMVEVFWSWLGSAIGIGLCGWLTSFWFEGLDLTLIIGSFGASAVLLYAAIHSPLAQPRNCFGGHVLSALIGVLCFKTLGDITWLAGSAAVSISIAAMLLTNTLHPPGGATALIAVIGSPVIHDLGYFYAVVPVAIGALVLLLVALVVNNIAPNRKYPLFW
jgi:CBS-domain-containing membrane protein